MMKMSLFFVFALTLVSSSYGNAVLLRGIQFTVRSLFVHLSIVKHNFNLKKKTRLFLNVEDTCLLTTKS